MLKHLECILPREFTRGIFDDDFRQFFVRYNEPSYIKYLKTELIPWIANPNNTKDIILELSEYVTDVDSELSKKAINALGEIAIRVIISTEDIIRLLLELVDLEMPYVRSEAVKNVTKIIRLVPNAHGQVLSVISKCLRRVEDSEAKANVIWLLGEFGHEIIEAPYLLESIINLYEDEESVNIKLTLLSVTVKLFFKRPPEVHKMLGKLLNFAINDVTNQDIHDKALLYYRLLSSDVNAAKKIFSDNYFGKIPESAFSVFAESRDDKKKDKIFQEFNSLSVIYRLPSQQFISQSFQLVNFHFILIINYNYQNIS
jgi:vesicle coat complex subunit